jgi:DNA primase
MNLPPGFVDELRSRLTLSSVVGRKVTWDRKKSNAAKGDWWAPCPFHQEKTASFHADDRKGFYYCFGCQAKGDVIGFVRETENLSFLETVERLAREAGMTMPAPDPQAAARADRASQLVAVMEQAVRHTRMLLRSGSGGPARDYLASRGLTGDALDRWEIGYAPDGGQVLWSHLTGSGIAPDLIIEAGLALPAEGGKAPWDRFRDRILFPIRDGRGRAIAFGGRAMKKDARAKYLNSPETPLFDKGSTLYNLPRARDAAARGAPVILAEGYMDVIALSEAGFPGAVAPLGTAVTDRQLDLAWRLASDPVVALDGDAAGQRAAARVIDLALPRLAPNRTLRFAVLPAGLDPDDLIRAQGPTAMQAVLDAARPMVEMLWHRRTADSDTATPEARAALQALLRDDVARIGDGALRAQYDRDIRDRLWALFRPARTGQTDRPRTDRRRSGPSGAPDTAPQPATRASLLAAGSDPGTVREAVILAALIAHPALLADYLSDLERTDFAHPGHAAIAAALLRHAGGADAARAQAAAGDLAPGALDALAALPHVRLARGARPADPTDDARACLDEAFGRLHATRAAMAEIAEAEADIAAAPDEVLTRRLARAAQRRAAADRGPAEADVEVVRAENGVELPRAEKDAMDRLRAELLGQPPPGSRRLPPGT